MCAKHSNEVVCLAHVCAIIVSQHVPSVISSEQYRRLPSSTIYPFRSATLFPPSRTLGLAVLTRTRRLISARDLLPWPMSPLEPLEAFCHRFRVDDRTSERGDEGGDVVCGRVVLICRIRLSSTSPGLRKDIGRDTDGIHIAFQHWMQVHELPSDTCS